MTPAIRITAPVRVKANEGVLHGNGGLVQADIDVDSGAVELGEDFLSGAVEQDQLPVMLSQLLRSKVNGGLHAAVHCQRARGRSYAIRPVMCDRSQA